ncbi:MAG TPA: hypothetical protein VFV99_17885 [Kofleriaceae bacterium]|nr:hypothetical protein [Kofleriaceae bacterium]
MARTIIGAFIIAFLVLCAVTTYRNVFADDSAVRAMAEKLAHDTGGCTGDCKTTRIEGKRGVFSTAFEFTMQNGAGIGVTCRRPYVAFGDYACTATKH